MKQGYLSQYFKGVGFKRLSAVEANRHRSNQHEFDGVAAMRRILGSVKRPFDGRFVYMDDEGLAPVTDSGVLTWYNAREDHPSRTEWRLYFPTTQVSEHMAEGDLLVIALRPDDSLLVIVARSGSTIESQLSWLFDIPTTGWRGYSTKNEADIDERRVEFASKLILEQIGVEIPDTADRYLDRMLNRFNGHFPTTAQFSAFARETAVDIDPVSDDADRVILFWMEREELLFRTLEKHLIGDRLKAGFEDVESFVSFSLTVQNRRKSRAGFALENHLEHLFRARRIRYIRTARTEGRAKPDFLFPGEAEYRSKEYSASLLTMLGVKSSCKDRWRQILAEADRISEKHLFTLEPGISANQTDEMRSRSVRLVLPREIHASYSPNQRTWLMDLVQFIEVVASRQADPRNSTSWSVPSPS